MVHTQLTIISKYFLPSVNVDSDAVYDMVKGLLEIDPNLKITIVTSDVTYKGDFKLNLKYNPDILTKLIVRKVVPFFAKVKMISDFVLGYQLVSLAKKVGNETIISLSNPPLISLWHSILLKKYNLLYWTFDIFPEALVADRLLKSKNVIYKIINNITYKNGPKGLISLGEYQYTYLSERYGGSYNKVLLPCGIHNSCEKDIPGWRETDTIHIGYLGNIGRAHSPVFLENVMKAVSNLPNVKFIISIYGFHSDRIKRFIKKLSADNIFFVPSVDKGHLKYIDVHLVSLLQEWVNISVPSKAVSAVCSGSALWYCGPEKADTFGYFEECSFTSTEDFASVQKTLATINEDEISIKKRESDKIKGELIQMERRAYKSIRNFIN